MKAYVYILQSLRDGRYYVGSTVDVERRLKEHNGGKVYSTKRFMPFKIILKQEFLTSAIAQSVERRIKKYKRKDFIDKILREGKIRVLGGSAVPTFVSLSRDSDRACLPAGRRKRASELASALVPTFSRF